MSLIVGLQTQAKPTMGYHTGLRSSESAPLVPMVFVVNWIQAVAALRWVQKTTFVAIGFAHRAFCPLGEPRLVGCEWSEQSLLPGWPTMRNGRRPRPRGCPRGTP